MVGTQIDALFCVFILQVVVFHGSYHVLGHGQVAADHIAFEPSVREHVPVTVYGMGSHGYGSLIIVFGIQAPGAWFLGIGTGITQTEYITAIIHIVFQAMGIASPFRYMAFTFHFPAV